ncbi:MAG TPA: citrate (Si)-synthase, partial [Anaerolineales bacterium]|nr:citrate (Si)-synthase [Anaerolineales bacterium]
MLIKERLEAKIPVWRERIRNLVTEKGDTKVGDVTVAQIYGGMRGVRCLVTDISSVDANEGIRLRGYSIPELLVQLPKRPGQKTPLVGGLYYLLLIGDIPTLEEALAVEDEWKQRVEVPTYVHDVLKAMPSDSHPMTLFSQAILAMQRESVFARRYLEGMNREDYWEAMLEDSLNLTARAPAIAAYIYHMKHAEAGFMARDPQKDWAANFRHMMGIQAEEYEDLSRLYFIIHSDHESGNVSAHATYLVASTLSDIYYSASASMNGLAGPLH